MERFHKKLAALCVAALEAFVVRHFWGAPDWATATLFLLSYHLCVIRLAGNES